MSEYKFTKQEKVVEVKTERVVAVGNMPPVGTRMRATLGNTVIEGRVHSQNFYAGGPRYEIVYLQVDGINEYRSAIDLWIGDGWLFELVDERELVGA